MKINQDHLDDLRERLKASCQRKRKPIYRFRSTHVDEFRGRFVVGVSESDWQNKVSQWGVHTMRLQAGLWEFHVMRAQTAQFGDEYYIGLAINKDSRGPGRLVRKMYSCPHRTPVAKALNKLFDFGKYNVTFRTKARWTRKVRSDKGRWKA